jgi:hypothetical protein
MSLLRFGSCAAKKSIKVGGVVVVMMNDDLDTSYYSR